MKKKKSETFKYTKLLRITCGHRVTYHRSSPSGGVRVLLLVHAIVHICNVTPILLVIAILVSSCGVPGPEAGLHACSCKAIPKRSSITETLGAVGPVLGFCSKVSLA